MGRREVGSICNWGLSSPCSLWAVLVYLFCGSLCVTLAAKEPRGLVKRSFSQQNNFWHKEKKGLPLFLGRAGRARMWPLPVFFSFLKSIKLMWAKSTGLTDWRAAILCLRPQTSSPLGWLVMCASEVKAGTPSRERRLSQCAVHLFQVEPFPFCHLQPSLPVFS